MGNQCSSAEENCDRAECTRPEIIPSIDDDEILFIGKQAAQYEKVSFEDLEQHGSSLMPTRSPGIPNGPIQEEPFAPCKKAPKDSRRAKLALAWLVRSLVMGRDVVLFSTNGSTIECVASLNKELTVLTIKRAQPTAISLRVPLDSDLPGQCTTDIPLEDIIDVTTEARPSRSPASPCKSCIRIRIKDRAKALAMQFGSKDECETFVACIRACAKQRRGNVEDAENDAGDGSSWSGSSSMVRSVNFLRMAGKSKVHHNSGRGKRGAAQPWQGREAQRSTSEDASEQLCEMIVQKACQVAVQKGFVS